MVKSQLTLRYIIRVISIVIVAILLSACTNSNTIKKKNIHSRTRVASIENSSSLKVNQNELKKIARNLYVKSRIMDQYEHWKGVRYRFGGSTKKGIDCSSFVQRTFREQFGLGLPRSTYKQQKIGKPISRGKLCTGDLVLFRMGSARRHVGIYIGNNQFIHASTSSGVTISNINEPYWQKRYNKARRVLNRG